MSDIRRRSPLWEEFSDDSSTAGSKDDVVAEFAEF
jgi:hypothetical protein